MNNELDTYNKTIYMSNDELNGIKDGQYWISTSDIETKPFEHKKDSYEKALKENTTIFSDWIERKSIKKDTTLLVKKLNFIDNILHSIDLEPHPTEKNGKIRRFLTEEFFEKFIKNDNGEQLRIQELNNFNLKLVELQNEITNKSSTIQNNLISSNESSKDITTMVNIIPNIDNIEKKISNQIDLAKNFQTFLKEKTEEIQDNIQIITNFHGEKAKFALAKVNDSLEYANHLNSGLRSLKLYTGEDVKINIIKKGNSALFNEPLTFYQRRLFLDEELAIYFDENGLDINKFENVFKILSEEKTIVDRMIPAERGVALVQIRRRQDANYNITTVEEIFKAIEDMKWNNASFLFIKDGENLYFVQSDLLWSYEGTKDDFDKNGLKRLFPSTTDLNQPFKGINGKDITPSDLEYVNARNKFDQRSLAYKRILLLLWGLNDREKLFGQFYDEKKYQNWMEQEFQINNFKFIADDDFVLEHKYKDIRDFINEKNLYLQNNSRVLCDWSDVSQDQYSFKEFFDSKDLDRDFDKAKPIWVPFKRREIFLSKENNGILSGKCLTRRRYEVEKTKKITVDLNKCANNNYLICLDDIRSNELTKYIHDRKWRENYGYYLHDFLLMYKHLKSEEEQQNDIINELKDFIRSNLFIPDNETVEYTIHSALRIWRNTHNGELAKSKFKDLKSFNQILNIIKNLNSFTKDSYNKIEEYCVKNNRIPYKVNIDSSGKIILYASLKEEEYNNILNKNYWVAKININDNKKINISNFNIIDKNEIEIVRWDNNYDNMVKQNQNIDFNKLKEFETELNNRKTEFFNIIDNNYNEEQFLEIAERTLNLSKKFVEEAENICPIGIYLKKKENYTLNKGKIEFIPYVIFIKEERFLNSYAKINETSFNHVENFIEKIYKNSENRINSMKNSIELQKRLSLHTIKLSKWKNYNHKNEELESMNYILNIDTELEKSNFNILNAINSKLKLSEQDISQQVFINNDIITKINSLKNDEILKL